VRQQRLYNSTCSKGRVTYSKDSFVVAETLVQGNSIFDETPPHIANLSNLRKVGASGAYELE
jgi:hypothetical protein